jgi:hypothetical protein
VKALPKPGIIRENDINPTAEKFIQFGLGFVSFFFA